VFVSGRPLQPSLMFVGKARSLPNWNTIQSSLTTNIRRSSGTNTLAYYEHFYIASIKSFITLPSGQRMCWCA